MAITGRMMAWRVYVPKSEAGGEVWTTVKAVTWVEARAEARKRFGESVVVSDMSSAIALEVEEGDLS